MKAQLTLNYAIWILRIMFMAAVIVSLAVLVNRYINARIDIAQPQASVLNYRLLMENGLMARDRFTRRAYPLVFDAGVFSLPEAEFAKRIAEQLGFDPALEFAAARLTFEHGLLKKTYHFDQRAFERFKELQKSVFGRNAVRVVSSYPVIIQEAKGPTSGTLTIEVFVAR